MPEADEILAGSSFNAEEGLQTVYGSVYTYGHLITSASVLLTPTGSLPNPINSVNGQLINYQSSTTGSLYFFDGTAWKQIQFAP